MIENSILIFTILRLHEGFTQHLYTFLKVLGTFAKLFIQRCELFVNKMQVK